MSQFNTPQKSLPQQQTQQQLQQYQSQGGTTQQQQQQQQPQQQPQQQQQQQQQQSSQYQKNPYPQLPQMPVSASGDKQLGLSEMRQQNEQRQQEIAEQSSSHSSWWRYFQIVNIFVSLLFGLGCLTLYPDIHLKNPKPFYLVIFYMAISILCFFFSLILMILFYLVSRLCQGQTQPQQQQQLPTHNNNNNMNTNNNSNNLNNSYSQLMDHSLTNFQQSNANQEQVPWCNVGWFPLVYYSTLYIAYFFYLIFSTTTIYKSWKKVPMLVSFFLIYVWLVGFFHVATAITLLFSRKFISRHIEEMEEADVYRIDDKEIQRRKQEILNARNRDIHNNNNY